MNCSSTWLISIATPYRASASTSTVALMISLSIRTPSQSKMTSAIMPPSCG
jgi:hypothetical protein